MLRDYYLQTADEESMNAALIETGVTDDDGNPTPGHSVSVIGTWHERTGGTDDEPVMTQLPGWHVNVRSAEPVEWPESVTVHEPRTPWRAFG